MNIIHVPCNETNYKKGRSSAIKYIVIHYTGNNGDTAKSNVDYYKRVGGIQASAHLYVDEFDTVYQSVKDGDTAWAVGAVGGLKYVHPSCRNSNSISIEICARNVNGSGKSATDSGWYFKEKTIDNAVNLTRELMKKYNVPIENVLRHKDVTGKVCPAPFVNVTGAWDKFKARLVEEEINMEELRNLQAQVDELTKTIAGLVKVVDKLANPMIYNYVDGNMPEWAREPIQSLMNKNLLRGNENGELGLDDAGLKFFVVLFRALEMAGFEF